MDEKQERTEALQLAIDTEEEGLEMYEAAAENAENLVAQKMFHGLAEDERRHLEMIKSIAQDMDLQEAFEAARGEGTARERMRTIFTEAKEEVVEKQAPTSDEYDALQRALKFEKDGYQQYKKAAANATDEKARKLFERLQGEEDEHYRILESTMEYLDETGKWFLSDEWGLLSGDMYAGE